MQQHSLPAANDIVAIVPLEVSYTLPMFSMPQEKKCAEPRQRPHNLSLFVNQQGSRLFIYFFVVGVFFFSTSQLTSRLHELDQCPGGLSGILC